MKMERKSLQEELVLAATVGVLVFLGFGIGRLTAPPVAGPSAVPGSGMATSPLPVPQAALYDAGSAAQVPTGMPQGQYVASKNGTKYYLPTCSGANRIKDENRIWFATEAEALAEGYGPA